MTVKQPVNDSQDRDNSGSDLQRSNEFFLPEVQFNGGNFVGKKFSGDETYVKVCAEELEMDQETNGSSEEIESPRSVATLVGQWTRKKIDCVHNQILRIRKEDSHLGKDIGEGLSAKDKLWGHHHHHQLASSHVGLMLFSRPILPASPLSGKTIH